MSDSMKRIQEDFERRMEEESTLLSKKRQIESIRIEQEYDRIQRSKEESQFYSNMGIGEDDPEELDRLQRENTEFFEASKTRMSFINDEFMDVVPFFAKQLLLIGAETGQGKSTTAANIIYTCLRQGKRCLLITNEENPTDVYNRIVCLIKGWNYDPKNWAEEQKNEMNSFYVHLRKYITIIDDNYKKHRGVTTTYEGFCGILDNLLTHDVKFDAVLVDYVQKINVSIKSPTKKGWEILRMVTDRLTSFKNEYMAPVVLLAQLHADAEDKSFEGRLKGYHGMLEAMTCAVELRPDKQGYRSEWIIKKSRWPIEQQGFFTGWFNGLFVSEKNDKYQKWKKDKLMSRARNLMEVQDGEIDKLGT